MHPSSTLLAFYVFLVALNPAPEAVEKPFRLVYATPPMSHQCCGIDCLYVCLRVLGRDDVALRSMEGELPVGPHGVSLQQITDYCRGKSVYTTTIQTDLAGLVECGQPLLLHVNQDHFIALLGVEKGRLVLFDNRGGLFDCTPEWFSAHYQWEGVAVIFGPPPPSLFVSMHRTWFASSVLAAGSLLLLLLVRERSHARKAKVCSG
jgi:ABC-type bacteriocin/lantibiotic exporter with double-glycine peptidase domain